MTPDSSQRNWDERYRHMARAGIGPTPDRWLERWEDILATAKETIVVDLGCGGGLDSHSLHARGLRPLGVDLSAQALAATRQRLPDQELLQADVRNLPLRPQSCQLILANLVLHYFPWQQTLALAAALNAALRPGGHLLCRLNSSDDVHFGAVGHPQLELGLYSVAGQPKRFFDRPAIERLFADGWRLPVVEQRQTRRYDRVKHLWEVLAEKP